MSDPKRHAALNIMIYTAALLVVAIQTGPFLELNPVLNTFFISTVCRLAMPFIFCALGYFLFQKIDDNRVRNENRIALWFLRMGRLYLVWTVIYIPYTIWNYAESGFNFFSIIAWIRDFLLNGSYYHLWFLPAFLLGMLLVYWMYWKKGLKFMLLSSLGLYLIGYLINIYTPIWESLPLVNIVFGFFTKTLVTARNGLFYAPVFIGLGAWIAKTGINPLKTSAIGFGISFLCLILEVTIYYSLGILTDSSCMFLCLVPCTWFLLQMVLRIKAPWKPIYAELRPDAILIVVSQILFARIFLLLLPDAHLVVYMLTLAFCQIFAGGVIRYRHRFAWLNYLM